jgi:hypothetical protein
MKKGTGGWSFLTCLPERVGWVAPAVGSDAHPSQLLCGREESVPRVAHGRIFLGSCGSPEL